MEFYKNEEPNLLRRIVSWIVDIVVVIALGWFTVYCFGTQVSITGNSMNPVLKSEDVVIMNRLIFDFSDPKRFDIVVFKRDNMKSNVKRIIGLPGETVQIKGGLIYINNTILKADNNLEKVSLAGIAEDPITLEPGEYFLLGDNRESSEDSRFMNIGNIKKEQILGKVWFRVYPVLDIDRIK